MLFPNCKLFSKRKTYIIIVLFSLQYIFKSASAFSYITLFQHTVVIPELQQLNKCKGSTIPTKNKKKQQQKLRFSVIHVQNVLLYISIYRYNKCVKNNDKKVVLKKQHF